MSGALFLKQAESLKKQVFAATKPPVDAQYTVTGSVVTGISNPATATNFSSFPAGATGITLKFGTALSGKTSYVKNLTSINIPSTITSIGNDVFRDCTFLRTVTFTNAKTLAQLGLGIFTNTPYLQAWAADLPLLLTKTSPAITLV